MDSRDQKRLAQGIQQQAALMAGFAKITHMCFQKCVPKPGKALSHTEETCATNCVDRTTDTQYFLIQRLQEQSTKEMKEQGMSSFN